MPDQASGLRVGEDAIDLDDRQPRVHWHGSDAQPRAGVNQLDVLELVREQEREPIAGPHALRVQPSRDPADAVVQLTKRRPDAARYAGRPVAVLVAASSKRMRVDHRLSRVLRPQFLLSAEAEQPDQRLVLAFGKLLDRAAGGFLRDA